MPIDIFLAVFATLTLPEFLEPEPPCALVPTLSLLALAAVFAFAVRFCYRNERKTAGLVCTILGIAVCFLDMAVIFLTMK